MTVTDNQEVELRGFYAAPTGPASQGGHDALCGLPREADAWYKTYNVERAYLAGYDEAQQRWPTSESRAWFSPT